MVTVQFTVDKKVGFLVLWCTVYQLEITGKQLPIIIQYFDQLTRTVLSGVPHQQSLLVAIIPKPKCSPVTYTTPYESVSVRKTSASD